ncbi:peptidoglycan DD-metalloendopeptidase family protein [Panacibacter ginsenosidivorans]|uniref:Peptidoglycan DD-metalloendopeptidase family protein n=1 Tax=Panacibacter ginsenosidivorans TaxID=1813871 RepID=A0A5B8V808_9BACT|nr:peptidoglycan DD-metalloendopeptidase family protein [Panacibacter ginsenosidivorans]QEC67544.1 peptidoglycan DD-metalloendopeptidase family protein [Panacibacter ginsenosidivorans]
MVRKIFILLLSVGIVLLAGAQETKEEIQKKQQQLMQEISSLNNTLNDIKKNKKQSLGQLAIVQRKIQARQELIYNINKELKRLNDNIYLNQVEIYRMKKELDTLKGQYAKSLVFAYKNRSSYEYLNFLFSAASFNDAIKRVTYLKSYRRYRETQADAIRQTQDVLAKQINTLNSNKQEKNNSLKEQGKQLTVLESDKKEKDQVVQSLKGQEKEIAAQLKSKEQMRQKLNIALQTVIKREIAAAKKKQEEEEKKRKLAEQQQTIANSKTDNSNTDTKTKATPKNNAPVTGMTATKSDRVYNVFESTTEEANISINFENSRGRLPWPADQGYVSTHFGPYTVPGTKLKGDMPGVEITLPVGSNIKNVADGEISAVFDLGNGQTVVIRHGKYFTTYTNLSNVSVSKGQQVKPGKVLGKAVAGMSGDGQIIFMVTSDKGTNMDPERWLKAR